MFLTTKGRYAVMAVADLAINWQKKPISLGEVASRQKIPLNYLEQIFIKLKSLKVVKSMRGPGGGYVLDQNSMSVTIREIMDAVEEDIKITRCSKEHGCVEKTAKCIAHDIWDGLTLAIRSYLDTISIKDLRNKQMNNENDISRP
ncbi:MAG: Rrf2 family transcriptional regulator [Rickettsiaceae bacterium]|nr:Rrf2 family transcriptional regulator [Rickettsiaceae bacterium]